MKLLPYNKCITLLCYYMLISYFSCTYATAQDTFISSCDKIPIGYEGKVFKIKTDYPDKIHNVQKPWESISFKQEPEKYAYAIINYIYEGNINCDFDLYCNKISNWYHAPWMHYGLTGREFVRGLTREKSLIPSQLHINQKSTFQNWAISIVNEMGAYTYGQVWKNVNKPDIKKGIFLNGTVSAKIIFTEATPIEVPYLKNSVEWIAYINQSGKGTPKDFKILRLLQIDFFVKDKRSKETGWVAGTFIYDSSVNNINPWFNIKLIGVSWGNDPDYSSIDYQQGKTLSESWVSDENSKHLGYLGRLAGPADNKNSSCLSCHSTAQYPERSLSVPVMKDMTEKEIAYWFRNLNSEAFDKESFNLDYSKQLSHGIIHFYKAQTNKDPTGCNNFNLP
ncbi:hypothetical protein [Candidatus Tisiphia endosymbiont of Nemotelus uliginosus]|uniref:hypothetical protein n=1 Tax=Candidatus Tisiphia endosymbiont of Nemotelus uliginosus TaxID=3077926 RepID=UPI0035C8CF6C